MAPSLHTFVPIDNDTLQNPHFDADFHQNNSIDQGVHLLQAGFMTVSKFS